MNEVHNLQEIKYEDEKIKIEYYLSGDWNFLAQVTGIGAANSNFWCKCHRQDRYKMVHDEYQYDIAVQSLKNTYTLNNHCSLAYQLKRW